MSEAGVSEAEAHGALLAVDGGPRAPFRAEAWVAAGSVPCMREVVAAVEMALVVVSLPAVGRAIS